jgi:predicted ArsR family transcriptional regulator
VETEQESVKRGLWYLTNHNKLKIQWVKEVAGRDYTDFKLDYADESMARSDYIKTHQSEFLDWVLEQYQEVAK